MEFLIIILIIILYFLLKKKKIKKKSENYNVNNNSAIYKANLKDKSKEMHPIKTSTELPSNFELTEEFKTTYQIMENTNKNMFITGKAGCGKSTLLEYFRINSKKNFVILAPTGIAAIKAQGSTIHSFFLLPHSILTESDIEEIKKRNTRRVINKLDTILIDESSMIRADILDGIDKSLRINRNINKPFGGVQMILIGDLFQLPPVVTGDEVLAMEHIYPDGNYFFNSNSYKKSNFTTYELNKIFRQKDEDFINILNQIRISKISQNDLDIINKRVVNFDFKLPKKTIVLSPTNRKVDLINNTNLNKIQSKTFTYSAVIEGKFGEAPVDEELDLKLGSQIMIVKNDISKPRRYVNGTIGFVIDLEKDYIKVEVDDIEIKIDKYTWERIQYKIIEGKIVKEVIASFTQYPIKLAWAVTIHKSQGQTFENVFIDLDTGAFSHGQTYVALSRSTSMDGLFFKRKIFKSDIIFDKRIYDFLSNKTINKYEKEIEENSSNYQERINKIRQKYANAYYPWTEIEDQKLIEYFKKNVTIEDISKILQRQPSALKGRLEKLNIIKDRNSLL